MRFKKSLMLTLAALIFSVLFVTPAFAQFADGTYSVPYEMKEANSNNTSIADGYFVSPASVTIKNGVATVAITVTGTQYVKDLPGSTTISEDTANNTRTVQYTINDITQPHSMKMHIVVPDMYDTVHTARAVFNTSGIPKASSEPSSTQTNDEAASTETKNEGTKSGETTTTGESSDEVVENPKTGEDSSMMLYALLMLLSGVALVAIWKFRPARN